MPYKLENNNGMFGHLHFKISGSNCQKKVDNTCFLPLVFNFIFYLIFQIQNMRSILIYCSLFFFAFSACTNDASNSSAAQNSPESFSKSLLSALKNKDEAKLWSHFIQKDELKEMLLTTANESKELDAQVEDMWAAMNEDKGNQYRVFERGEIDDWSKVSIDSVRLNVKKPHQLGDDITINPNSKVEGTGALHVYLKADGKASHMLLPCIKMKNGTIKMVAYPRFD